MRFGALFSSLILLTEWIDHAAGDLFNAAQGKPATQSSTSFGDSGVAANAVDGNRNGNWRAFGNSISHTWLYGETDPWWEVDLQGNFSVHKVHIYNRIDPCCEHRISGAVLELYEAGNPTPVATGQIEDVGDTDLFLPTPAGSYKFVFEFDLPLVNRVRVHIPGSETALKVLSLAEVEVWALVTPVPPPPSSSGAATAPSDVPSGSPSDTPSSSPTDPPPSAAPSDMPSASPTDSCADLADAYFLVGGERHDCAWLKLQSASTIAQHCALGAVDICYHTCTACHTRRANPDATTEEVYGCEDLYNIYFPLTDGSAYKDCIWLTGREEVNQYCVVTNPAYHICENTCNKCVDICKDQPGQIAEYVIDPSQQLIGSAKTCADLADIPRDQPFACAIPSIKAMCQDVCDSCGIPSAIPSESPSDMPSQGPTVAVGAFAASESPSETPSAAPTEFVCDDDPTSTFLVLHYKTKDCRWLAGHMSRQIASDSDFASMPTTLLETYYNYTSISDFNTTTFGDLLCDPMGGHVAYDLCEETCAKCTDDCVDDDSKEFETENNGMQRCPWLRAKPNNIVTLHCNNGSNATLYCKETCGVCDRR